MKKFLILAAVIGLTSCGSPFSYVIDGNIAGLDEQVYLFDNNGTPIDSARADKGVFRIKGEVEQPAVTYLGTAPTSKQRLALTVILEPGKHMVRGNVEDPLAITISGTPSNDAFAAFEAESRQLVEQSRAPEITPEQRAALDDQYAALCRATLDKNSDNFFGAMLLAQQLIYEMRASEILDAVARFPESLRNNEILLKVKTTAEEKQRTEVGQPYIEIVQNNAQGQPVSLKSTIENPANKYVFVDFWASWCKPCMAEVPYLLADYAEYHTKGFEIYGISFDTEIGRWTTTVKEKGMDWIHVSDLRRFDNQAARDYAVNSIPANFLIDCATGKIVAVNLRGKALGEKLAELLK